MVFSIPKMALLWVTCFIQFQDYTVISFHSRSFVVVPLKTLDFCEFIVEISKVQSTHEKLNHLLVYLGYNE